jgi:hypothetical protein
MTQTTPAKTPAAKQRLEVALERASRIQVALDSFTTDMADAYNDRDWEALDLPDWAAYCKKHLGGWAVAIGERPEVFTALHDAGMSTRAIADATGTSKSTVSRTVSKPASPGVPGGTPAFSPTVTVDGKEHPVVVAPATRTTTTGTDGKSYPRPAPATRPAPASQRPAVGPEIGGRRKLDLAFADLVDVIRNVNRLYFDQVSAMRPGDLGVRPKREHQDVTRFADQSRIQTRREAVAQLLVFLKDAGLLNEES